MIKKNQNIILFFFIFFHCLTLSTEVFAAKKARKPADRSIMHNNLGVTALYEGNIERAIFEFKTSTELSPNYVEAWNNLGLAYKYKGKMELAINALQKAISLDKKYPSPYNHLGAVYYDLGRFNDAIAEFDKAIRNNKKFSDAYYNKGITYAAMARKGNKEHFQNAVKTLSQATSINPEHPYAHHQLAKIYQELGQFEQAIIRYKLALEINPKLSDAWVNLSNLYNQTGETLKAQQALNNAIVGEESGSPEAHMSMGLSYLKENNYQMALKEFDTVIRKSPTNEMAYFNAGYTHYQLGIEAKNKGQGEKAKSSLGQAIKAYESALTLKPNFDDAAYNVAYTYQVLGDAQQSIEWYLKTIELNPKHARSLYSLADLYQTQGDENNAIKYYCRLLTAPLGDLQVDINHIREITKAKGGCKQ
ncbi:MAG: hypothetical protein A3G32_01630 [Deltaproteobacteria bacterium RIFCSPLOWO2_12_FULL_40_28]|nr:MAG: hypothetical protein A3C45_06375 [Deltaproteobacteria bacterium RIFCSPHIGHO2_02_FULL_40_28]OGQ18833.1 MAG: hypothetical protein A3E27_09010 [Deltaproteobacteria bacterium RIFCSPHIGHO2_12_FULL_40_32]OGQ40078.1 MAG: hypothetical protein A3I69_01540 [Deltaproteobacteria bacterium RIFCSPLOWO2_02_FULL_40_36]OGQ53261.1 MAG: hypothetical protein A3G32_01630 [Deltaproteobacteria bacterium RIFCSPLOWO2_12_FULL_40_28]